MLKTAKKDIKSKKLTTKEKELVHIADAYINRCINENDYIKSLEKSTAELITIKKSIDDDKVKFVRFEKMDFLAKRKLLLDTVKYIRVDMYDKTFIKIEYKDKI